MIHKSVCPLWLADIPSGPCRKARQSAASYTTSGDTIDDLAWIRANVSSQAVPFMAKTRLEAPDGESQLDLLFQLNPFLCEIYFDRLEQIAERKALFQKAGIALWVNTLDSVSCAGFTDSAALKDPQAIWGRLINAGISAIQTDEPGALKAYLKSR